VILFPIIYGIYTKIYRYLNVASLFIRIVLFPLEFDAKKYKLEYFNERFAKFDMQKGIEYRVDR